MKNNYDLLVSKYLILKCILKLQSWEKLTSSDAHWFSWICLAPTGGSRNGVQKTASEEHY